MSRIRELRKQRGMNQERLAHLVGTSQQTISKIEKDRYKAPTDLLINIARCFNVTVDYLLELTDSKRSLEEQIEVNRALDDHYELLAAYLELNRSNRRTVEVLMKRLREAQEEEN